MRKAALWSIVIVLAGAATVTDVLFILALPSRTSPGRELLSTRAPGRGRQSCTLPR